MILFFEYQFLTFGYNFKCNKDEDILNVDMAEKYCEHQQTIEANEFQYNCISQVDLEEMMMRVAQHNDEDSEDNQNVHEDSHSNDLDNLAMYDEEHNIVNVAEESSTY
ncbi:hypothetical protein COEREDRAFT_8977 [Coemansia reversa NRRL 1564]|uniref:Uncharacterized protein n=1 Tax=Coemansia reversa (strain ATCC 12441 / NRRL 1564) TaxID=763665 RepID=A0A2G5B9U1_COERN|nr:hypothetical protein COEREDRAFT_8977 [Coemansia reversa NRRL 1564]|eukprot:PIA15742.1 hypothetical protein COEREDRAFT_8977 [Coemansia reversa NRRL 1564]